MTTTGARANAPSGFGKLRLRKVDRVKTEELREMDAQAARRQSTQALAMADEQSSAIYNRSLLRLLSSHAPPAISSISAAEGSGILATRKPKLLSEEFDGTSRNRFEERKLTSELSRKPPRSARLSVVTLLLPTVKGTLAPLPHVPVLAHRSIRAQSSRQVHIRRARLPVVNCGS